MAENQNWKKMEELLDRKLTPFEKLLAKPNGSGEKETRTPEEITKENVAHVLECPNCYPLVKKAVIDREFKDADHECVECGLNVRKEDSEKENWDCPSCGNKTARERGE